MANDINHRGREGWETVIENGTGMEKALSKKEAVFRFAFFQPGASRPAWACVPKSIHRHCRVQDISGELSAD